MPNPQNWLTLIGNKFPRKPLTHELFHRSREAIPTQGFTHKCPNKFREGLGEDNVINIFPLTTQYTEFAPF
jgi:hypothetical protein